MRFVTGFTEDGEKLLAYPVANHMLCGHSSKFSKPIDRKNLIKNLRAVIFVDGLCKPACKKEIILRSLERGYKMLTAKETSLAEYGYGEGLWSKWISRLENDKNYKSPSSSFKYINPEKFDMAERRYYGSYFFSQAEKETGLDLSVPKENFRAIHDKMWDVHWPLYGENKQDLRLRETRERIVWILKECRDLERDAACALAEALGI